MIPHQSCCLVISCVVELLREPRPGDPLEMEIAEEYSKNKAKFLDKAKEFTATYSEKL